MASYTPRGEVWVCCENGDPIWCPREWLCPHLPGELYQRKRALMRGDPQMGPRPLPFHERYDLGYLLETVELPHYHGARVAPNIRDQKFAPDEADQIQYLAALYDAATAREGPDAPVDP